MTFLVARAWLFSCADICVAEPENIFSFVKITRAKPVVDFLLIVVDHTPEVPQAVLA